MRGKCRLLHTPLGAADNRAFQTFLAKPPATPVDIYMQGENVGELSKLPNIGKEIEGPMN